MQEFLNKITELAKKYTTMEDLIDENYDDEEIKTIKFVETINTDEHRWYCVDTNVYKAIPSNQTTKNEVYFAVDEVGTIKSEGMTASDCISYMIINEVEKIVKKTFKIKDK